MARVRVGGTWLHSYTRVGDLRWRHAAEGGCSEASWSIGRRPSIVASSVLERGAAVDIFDGFQCVWSGVLTGDAGRTGECAAVGLMRDAARYDSTDNLGVPTDDVEVGIATAQAAGWGATYLGDVPSNAVPNEQPEKLDAVINSRATANSVRATIRPDRVLRWETSDPTGYVVLPGVGVLGRADEDFATRVTVRYISSVSGTPPVADDWETVTVVDDRAETVYGRSSLFVGLESRGLLTATEAGWIADGILAKYGARLSFSESVTLSAGQLRDVGGSRVSLATVEAGRNVRFLGVWSPAQINSTAFDVTIGATDYADGSGQITLSPMGLVPRTLADVIASVPTIHTALNPAPGAGAVSAA